MLGIGLFFAGGLGAVCRYGLSIWVARMLHQVRLQYLSMVFVNILGSFCLGGVDAYFMLNQVWYTLLGVGFCGAFTTFSTFSYEALEMLLHKQYRRAGLYILLTIILCCVCYQVGYSLLIKF